MREVPSPLCAQTAPAMAMTEQTSIMMAENEDLGLIRTGDCEETEHVTPHLVRNLRRGSSRKSAQGYIGSSAQLLQIEKLSLADRKHPILC